MGILDIGIDAIWYVFGILAAVAGVYFTGRSNGASAKEAEVRQQSINDAGERHEHRIQIDNSIADTDPVTELHNKWSRD